MNGNKKQFSVLVDVSEDIQNLPLKRMLSARNNNLLWKVVDVGSVSITRSTELTKTY